MDVQDISDFLEGFGWFEPGRTATHRACRDVIERLPEEIQEQIVHGQTMVIFAPGRQWGQTLPYSLTGMIEAETGTKVTTRTDDVVQEFRVPSRLCEVQFSLVYLSPELEDQKYPVLLGVVAHEIAHAVTREIEGDDAERTADDLARSWGFGAELNAVQQANPNHRY